MICSNCGQEIGNASFCPFCGASNKPDAAQQPAASATPAAPVSPAAPAAPVTPAAPVPPAAPAAPGYNPYAQSYAPNSYSSNAGYNPYGAGSSPYSSNPYAAGGNNNYGSRNSAGNQGNTYGSTGSSRPALVLPTSRGLLKMIFLGILTLGIYDIVILSRVVTELNITASRYDGRRTMPFFGMTMLAPLTLFIYTLCWYHGLSDRIGNELHRRGINYSFGASTFWLWNVLGTLILVGPFVYTHKLMKSVNLINGDFNVNG